MCGICGFFSKQNITLDQLRCMNETMSHRGPDDRGEEIYVAGNGYCVGLAHRRLSILDLSEQGHQPMHSPDRAVSIVFNGEIYNFLELKKELADYPFHSDCDTEVIVAAYLKWGIQCLERLNGMFAIAIFDRRNDEMFLIRDRIGKKPLYYELDGGNLAFASELKPILSKPGFQKKIRQDILSRYLFQQYISAPDTIFEGVFKLEPGAVLHFHNGNVKTWKYWDINAVYHKMQKDPVTDYKEAKSELKKRLKKAVSDRMIADVMLGAFLSGGYDSSLMTAMAQECSDKPVKTFSIGFADKRYDEAGYAKQVADYLGTDHTERYITEREMFELVESIPRYYDEPFADSSQIATMLVSSLAKKDVTVALSGDGGDEFFCGYNIYQNVYQAQKLDALGEMVHGICNLPGIRSLNMTQKLPFRVRVIAENRNRETKTQFGADNYVIRAEKMALMDGKPCHYEWESRYEEKNWQICRMLLDMETYLPDDILCKVDRASMKYSLEARCPILDKEVMEYSFRLPHNMKYNRGIKKRILKDIAYEYIPKELLDRPKVGFGVPLDQWLRGPLKEQLLSMSSKEYLVRQGIFDADYTSHMIEDYIMTGDGGPATGRNYSKISWSFFVFQQWYRYYFEDHF